MNPIAREAQVRWEMSGFTRAQARFRDAMSAKEVGEMPASQALLRDVVPSLACAIRLRQAEAVDALGKPGRAPEWAWPVQLVDAEQLAVLTVCVALRSVTDFGSNGVASPGQATALFRGIANAIRMQIEYERWTKAAERDVLAAFHRRYPTVNRKVWQRWRRKVDAARAEAWPESVQMATGGLLVGLLVEVAPARFSIEMKRVQGRTIRTIVLSQETQEMLNDVTARAEVARPVLLPMIVEPLPWRYQE